MNSCNSVSIRAVLYQFVQLYTNPCSSIPIRAILYQFVQFYTNSCNSIPIHAVLYQSVLFYTNLCCSNPIRAVLIQSVQFCINPCNSVVKTGIADTYPRLLPNPHNRNTRTNLTLQHDFPPYTAGKIPFSYKYFFGLQLRAARLAYGGCTARNCEPHSLQLQNKVLSAALLHYTTHSERNRTL